MKAKLTFLLAQIDKQMQVIEDQAGIIRTGAQNEDFNVFMDKVDPFYVRLEDGSYPMVPLLVAKAQVLSALTMLEIHDTTIIVPPHDLTDPMRS